MRLPSKLAIAGFIFVLSATGLNTGGFAASGTNCVVEQLKLVDVVIGNINKAPDVPAQLSFRCDVNMPSHDNRVAACFHIHNLSTSPSGQPIRYAKRTGGGKIGFNFYHNGQRIGDISHGENAIALANKIGSKTYRAVIPFVMHYEGNYGMDNLPDGNYIYDNPEAHLVMRSLSSSDTLNKRTACGSASLNWAIIPTRWKFDTKVNVGVGKYCNIYTEDNMKFDKQTQLDKEYHAQAIINADCSGGIDYEVNIGKGNYYADGMRHMKVRDDQARGSIAYDISPENLTDLGVGSSAGKRHIIKGTVPAQTTPPVGVYSDTLVAEIKYLRPE